MRAGAGLFAFLVLTAALAGAEHAPEFRYVVLGYVTDTAGKPVAAAAIQVVRDKTGLAYAGTTDTTGFYVVVVRLADESLGESLTVRLGERASSITVRFDPANHLEERGTRVDVKGTRFVETPTTFKSTLNRFLAAPVR
ncbi:MAG TPA: carboxypeptidase-like regulatory domain-containing protein [Methylomirabilota bacterium]|jgi:hypothetical protein